MSERKRKRPHVKRHLFSNIAFCADCGKSMHYKSSRRGYICGTFNKHGRTQCSNHHIEENELIKIIQISINQMVSNLYLKSVQRDIEKKITKDMKCDQKRLDMVFKEIESLKNDKTAALRLKIRGEIQDEEYKMLIDDNSVQITELNEERVTLEKRLLHQRKNEDLQKLIQQIKEFTQKPVLDKKMVQKLIERIEIKEDGNPRFYYRFSDHYMSSFFAQ
ncbi:recombinase zinc beta ribbon domain-containing protein [Mesobacillus zeae]|uniref:recombinase zinc beta ribbon domain-containing protein n=1 Tax=Mesobacillus zeae TaxID=1917180 RepID=UPI00217537EB|nr:recombinase zinc beta ribbon domain-containing protein [Mesobacillus zeae]